MPTEGKRAAQKQSNGERRDQGTWQIRWHFGHAHGLGPGEHGFTGWERVPLVLAERVALLARLAPGAVGIVEARKEARTPVAAHAIGAVEITTARVRAHASVTGWTCATPTCGAVVGCVTRRIQRAGTRSGIDWAVMATAAGDLEINMAGCEEILGEVSCAPAMQQEFLCEYGACVNNCAITDASSFSGLFICMSNALAGACSSKHSAAQCLKDPSNTSACSGSGFQAQFVAVAKVFCL
jgi:hypothetical protein